MNHEPDHFDASPVGDGVLVRMSDNVARTLAHHLGLLARFLEDDVYPEPRRSLLRRRPPRDVLAALFPDACPSRAESEDFRARHAAELRDAAPVRRVLERCATPTPFVLTRAEADDWLIALPLARRLPRRPGPERVMVEAWFAHAHEYLVLALRPDLVDLRR
ncbi:DUF2017 family protein [Actinosynnema pretiosum]|uniref:DUF2017 domain-containing protein n=1 Tax=Actinosynnema pretiosum TaxID=42197 RepID=A0A290Z560_9PSEU|nr:DUF2017 family protein [Actinosynnema pretiosum]ATE54124.1 hypothetical protein CNX65_13170 [Actinosynnema pretiosum]